MLEPPCEEPLITAAGVGVLVDRPNVNNLELPVPARTVAVEHMSSARSRIGSSEADFVSRSGMQAELKRCHRVGHPRSQFGGVANDSTRRGVIDDCIGQEERLPARPVSVVDGIGVGREQVRDGQAVCQPLLVKHPPI